MGALLAISRWHRRCQQICGLVAIWLVLLAALVSAFNAIFRYSISTILYLDTKLRVFGGGLGFLFDLYRDNSNSLRDAAADHVRRHGDARRLLDAEGQ